MVKKRVLIGLSGGVDSSVAAYLLKKEGYEVIGITFNMFPVYNLEGEKVQSQHIIDAQKIADLLKIQHNIHDYSHLFKAEVIEPFISNYINGYTPNPCLMCNKSIKFGEFFNLMNEYKADYIATGHYLQKIYSEDNQCYHLLKGNIPRKDQSYLMHFLTQDKLEKVLFPLGHFCSKSEVRSIAQEIGIPVYNKKDSQDICFIPDKDYRQFIRKNLDSPNDYCGKYIDTAGNVLGKHDGIYNYTIGQKKGLGLSVKKSVVAYDLSSKNIIVGEDEETYSKSLLAIDMNIIDKNLLEKKLVARVCQWGYDLPVKIKKITDDMYQVRFKKPERAIAPGQAIVFYHKNIVVGGGIIQSTQK